MGVVKFFQSAEYAKYKTRIGSTKQKASFSILTSSVAHSLYSLYSAQKLLAFGDVHVLCKKEDVPKRMKKKRKRNKG